MAMMEAAPLWKRHLLTWGVAQNYGLNFLAKKGFTPMQCPFMMSKTVMAATAQLDDFE